MPAVDGTVDLRSDTVTTPTAAMRSAMAAAEVGDDGYGEDPTVARLEALAASRVGMDAALFVPTGTMGNQLAVRVQAAAGADIVCPARAHVRRYEATAGSRYADVCMRPLPDQYGMMAPRALEVALAGVGGAAPPVLLIIENTHMPSGGRPLTPSDVEGLATIARAHGAAVHCDGARIHNAAVALDTTPASLVSSCDTVMFCLSKGLGAPVGSVLCGPADVIAEARLERKRLGGTMRQAGIIAAAGIVALVEMVDRLVEDHRRAALLAAEIADRFPGAVEPASVRTNIVCARGAALPPAVVDRLLALGVRAGMIDDETVRFVVHKDVDDDDVTRVVSALGELERG